MRRFPRSWNWCLGMSMEGETMGKAMGKWEDHKETIGKTHRKMMIYPLPNEQSYLEYPDDPWCCYIYLQNWIMYGVNDVAKYTIHGSSGRGKW